jgi:hypothetical protein
MVFRHRIRGTLVSGGLGRRGLQLAHLARHLGALPKALFDQRAPAPPLTSTLNVPPTFTQVSLPATFTKPGPNAAQALPAALFAGGSRSGGVA